MSAFSNVVVYAPMILMYGAFGVMLIFDSWKCRHLDGEDAAASVTELLVGVCVLACAIAAVKDVWFGG